MYPSSSQDADRILEGHVEHLRSDRRDPLHLAAFARRSCVCQSVCGVSFFLAARVLARSHSEPLRVLMGHGRRARGAAVPCLQDVPRSTHPPRLRQVRQRSQPSRRPIAPQGVLKGGGDLTVLSWLLEAMQSGRSGLHSRTHTPGSPHAEGGKGVVEGKTKCVAVSLRQEMLSAECPRSVTSSTRSATRSGLYWTPASLL